MSNYSQPLEHDFVSIKILQKH